MMMTKSYDELFLVDDEFAIFMRESLGGHFFGCAYTFLNRYKDVSFTNRLSRLAEQLAGRQPDSNRMRNGEWQKFIIPSLRSGH